MGSSFAETVSDLILFSDVDPADCRGPLPSWWGDEVWVRVRNHSAGVGVFRSCSKDSGGAHTRQPCVDLSEVRLPPCLSDRTLDFIEGGNLRS